LKEQCKALKLAHIPSIYLEVTYHDREQYLTDLFAAELEERHAKKIRNLIKRAGFPAHKTLEEFDWSPVTLPGSTTITDLAELTFIERRENVLALGPWEPAKRIWPSPWGFGPVWKGEASVSTAAWTSSMPCWKITVRAVCGG